MDGFAICIAFLGIGLALAAVVMAIVFHAKLAAALAQINVLSRHLNELRMRLDAQATLLRDLSARPPTAEFPPECPREAMPKPSANAPAPKPPAVETPTLAAHLRRTSETRHAQPPSPAESPKRPEPAVAPKEAPAPPLIPPSEPVPVSGESADADEGVGVAAEAMSGADVLTPAEEALFGLEKRAESAEQGTKPVASANGVPADASLTASESAQALPPLVPPPAPKPPPRPMTVEERLMRIAVWIAAIALALGGIYLVKYSFDNKLLRPEVRLAIGAVFGLGLVGAGEWMRRKSRGIAQALVAAGVATLFAVMLAGMHVEHLIPKPVGFALMAITACAAVILSLRHGPFVALLGLAGGFATPALVGGDEHNAPVLFAYLFVLQLALVVVTRRRGWWVISALTLFCGYFWVILWLAAFFRPGDEMALSLFLLGTSATFVLGTWVKSEANPSTLVGWLTIADIVRWAGAALGLLLMGWVSAKVQFGTTEWVFLGILGAGCIVIARLDARNLGLAWLASAATGLFLTAWRIRDFPLERPGSFGATVLAFGVLYAIGPYAALWKDRRPGMWASLSALSAITFGAVGYFGINYEIAPHFWGIACLAAAAIYAMLAAPLLTARTNGTMPGVENPLAAVVLAAAAFAALAAPIELERQWITVAWAALVPAVVGVELWLRVKPLRAVVAVLLAAVAMRLLLNPAVLHYPIGATPIVNWLLYGYGIPIVALALAGWLYRRGKLAPELTQFIDALAIALGMALVTLEIRHFFHREQGLATHALGFNEAAMYPLALLSCGVALLLARGKANSIAMRVMAFVALGAGSLTLFFGVVTVFSPLFNAQTVGATPVVNWLLFAYLAPAAMFAAAAVLLRKRDEPVPSLVAATVSGMLLLLWIGLAVRQGFNGEAMTLDQNAPELLETATYPIAWAIAGLAAQVLATRFGSARFEKVGAAVAGGAIILALAALCVFRNPLWVRLDVGETVVLNRLLYSHLVPALLAAAAGWLAKHSGETQAWRFFNGVALVFAFTLLNLEIRQGYHGSVLVGGTLASAENYTYSALWAVFGAALLIGGIALRSVALRWASLSVMMLTIGKVFIWDMSQLRDLLRVFSFVGLGLTLLAVAFLYQKFVFRRPANESQ